MSDFHHEHIANLSNITIVVRVVYLHMAPAADSGSSTGLDQFIDWVTDAKVVEMVVEDYRLQRKHKK